MLDFETFEAQWKNKIVRLKGKCFKFPKKNYQVTAALYQYEDGDVTIFAIMAEDYIFGPDSNRQWFTIKINPEDFDKCMDDFEIVE